jgi:ABC-type sugar transport system substrate-binding protein
MSDQTGGFDRRTLLKRGGMLALAAALPLDLVACGKTTHVEAKRVVAFLYESGNTQYPTSSFNPPLGDFFRLVGKQARKEDVSFVVTVSSNGERETPAKQLTTDVQPTEFDPSLGESPASYPVIVVSVPKVKLGPSVVRAVEGGVQLVAFLYPSPHAAASITVDAARMGRMLGADILAWSEGKGAGEVMLVERRPPAPRGTVPFTATETESAAALRSALAAGESAPRIVATATVANEDSEDGIRAEHVVREALAAHPTVRMVACLDDSAAVGAARALAAARPGQVEDLYVGGLGAPTASSQKTLEALEGPGCFRALVAASPRTLADALVEVSVSLLEGEEAEDISVPPLSLQRGSTALRRYARDYTPDGYLGFNEVEPFFVINPQHPQPDTVTGPRAPQP